MIGAIFYDNKLLKEMKKYYNIEGEKVLLNFRNQLSAFEALLSND